MKKMFGQKGRDVMSFGNYADPDLHWLHADGWKSKRKTWVRQGDSYE